MLSCGHFYTSALVVPVKTRRLWLQPGCEPSPPLQTRSLAQHCILLDISSVIMRCTPTAHVQRILDLCLIICSLRPAPCSFLVFLALYILVGKICWYNSWIPATVCVGAVFHSEIQAKQSLSRSSSFHRFTISFPCHFSSSISSFRLLCTQCFLCQFIIIVIIIIIIIIIIIAIFMIVSGKRMCLIAL